jgi:triosephosphate isomerase
MRVIRRFSAVLVGFVLFLSGILKLMDPVGARLVVEDYLQFLHLGFLSGLAGLAGSGLALLETVLGTALITGVWRRLTAIVTGILLGFFTILTLILYIGNPPMDCGCFGEIVHLTHLQSLIKNVVLLLLWALASLPLNKLGPTRKIKFVSFSIVAVSVCLFMLYSSLSIPLIDFTPFKPGAEMMLPEEIEDPTDDRTPTLSLSDATGEYVDSLMVSGKVLAVSVYMPEKLRESDWERIGRVMRESATLGYNPVVLAAAMPATMESLTAIPEILASTYFADRKKLLTLNRSNGGATYVDDGLIVAKWGRRRLPNHDKLAGLSGEDAAESLLTENNGSRLKFQAFLLYVFAVMLLL